MTTKEDDFLNDVRTLAIELRLDAANYDFRSKDPTVPPEDRAAANEQRKRIERAGIILQNMIRRVEDRNSRYDWWNEEGWQSFV